MFSGHPCSDGRDEEGWPWAGEPGARREEVQRVPDQDQQDGIRDETEGEKSSRLLYHLHGAWIPKRHGLSSYFLCLPGWGTEIWWLDEESPLMAMDEGRYQLNEAQNDRWDVRKSAIAMLGHQNQLRISCLPKRVIALELFCGLIKGPSKNLTSSAPPNVMVRKKFWLHKENSQTHPGATIQLLTLTCIYGL